MQLFGLMETQFLKKGEYLFKKGQFADYAYVVLYGSAIILEVTSVSFIGNKAYAKKTPPTLGRRMTTIVKDGITTVE